MSDLPTVVFMTLRRWFFDSEGRPKSFRLRDKRNTQDDPFDEYLAKHVLAGLHRIACVRASGPLVTPDMVLYRPERCVRGRIHELADDIDRIVALEVKKLERTSQGSVARRSGLDYNTTPPCGRVRVHDVAGKVVDIRGFYLFVCVERISENASDIVVTALCMVDGNALNEDFGLYLSTTGQREKRIGLGSYGDGADRTRPMLIFANPLGVPEFDQSPILIHPSAVLEQSTADLRLAYRLRRSASGGGVRTFYCYRYRTDLPDGWTVTDLLDPFPTPAREARTRPRGKFRLPFRV